MLFEVYGIESGTYLTDGHGPDADFERFSVVKTHHLPHELPLSLQRRPAVYLIRDGRDSIVSFAHHRKDIIAPESDYQQNLKEAIYAAEGSHFGGWSRHVEEWSRGAKIIIRFEDLIQDPIGQCERLRAVMDLPEAKRENLPGFEQLKRGIPKYGAGKELDISESEQQEMAQKWFRRGKVGSWKEELPEDMERLFWHLHGEMMEVAGYPKNEDEPLKFRYLNSRFQAQHSNEKVAVEIESTKLIDPFTDGIKRYVLELLKTYDRYQPQGFEFISSIAGEQWTLKEALAKDGAGNQPIETGLLYGLKEFLRMTLPQALYNQIARNVSIPKIRAIFSFRSTKKIKTDSHAIDVQHLTLPQNYRFIENRTIPLVATFHDLTHQKFPETHDQSNVTHTEDGMQWAKSRNALGLSVSASTQSDLKVFGFDSRVIHLGVNRREFYPIHNQHLLQLVKERYQLPDREFLLSVSTLEPRKNILTLVQAYAKLPKSTREQCHLVLAGRKGWKWNELDIPKDCKDQIHFTGFVRESHLPALYTLARGFCYMSLYEGFGLPVLEAMACGTAVICSNNSSLVEVAGDAGLNCDPLDQNQIMNHIERLILDDDLAQELSKRGMERSWQFTWSRTAEKTLQAYVDCQNRAKQKH